MKKNEFLHKLDTELKLRNVADRDDIITYYEDIIDGKIEQGRSEDEALHNYQDIDKLVKEIILESAYNKPFTYSDYVKENPSKNTSAGDIIAPIKQNGIYTTKAIINDKSNIIVRVWERKININSSSEIDKLCVNYHKRILNPIEVTADGDDIRVFETKSSFWLPFLFRILIFVIIFFSSVVIFESYVDKTLWWHYLIIAVATSSIINLSSLFVYLSTRKKKNIDITVPRNFKLNSLNTIVRSGKINIEKIVAKNMSVKIVSGKVTLNDFHADEIEIKVSSGSAVVGEEGHLLSSKINHLALSTSSGNIRLHGISATNLNSKTSSGTLKIYDSKCDKVFIKCSSGSVKGENLTLLDNNIIVSSGSVKLNNLILGSTNIKVSSGTIKLNEIDGSENHYMINTKISSGYMKINHKKMDFLGYKLVKDMPQKSITARVSSGTIHLNFKKDNHA